MIFLKKKTDRKKKEANSALRHVRIDFRSMMTEQVISMTAFSLFL